MTVPWSSCPSCAAGIIGVLCVYCSAQHGFASSANVPALPPLPDGWIRCSEKMPLPGQWVQFAERAHTTVFAGFLSIKGYWWDYANPTDREMVPLSRVVAWRPLTVPDAVREL